MSKYVDPNTVESPKNRTNSKVAVIYNGGCGGYALSFMWWDSDYAIGIRWNGGKEVSSMPVSRVPVWFVLPCEIGKLYIQKLNCERKLLDIKDPIMKEGFEKYLKDKVLNHSC